MDQKILNRLVKVRDAIERKIGKARDAALMLSDAGRGDLTGLAESLRVSLLDDEGDPRGPQEGELYLVLDQMSDPSPDLLATSREVKDAAASLAKVARKLDELIRRFAP